MGAVGERLQDTLEAQAERQIHFGKETSEKEESLATRHSERSAAESKNPVALSEVAHRDPSVSLGMTGEFDNLWLDR